MSEQPHSSTDGPAGARVRDDKLQAYMLGHYTGALSGVRLFDEARRTWDGTVYADRFATFHREIQEDVGHLETMLDRLGADRRKAVKVLGTATGFLSRFNPLSRVRERAGLAAHGELEVLQSLVVAKRSMWLTLLQLAPAEPRLDAEELRRLEAAAADQYDRIRDVAEATARDRFLVEERAR
jgi:hypothetical protein